MTMSPDLPRFVDRVNRTLLMHCLLRNTTKVVKGIPIIIGCVWGCSDNTTEPPIRLPPSIVIEHMVQEGYDPANVRVFFHASARSARQDHQLSRAEYRIDGTLEASFPLSDSEVKSSFVIRRLEPRSYSLELVVYDLAGGTGKAHTSFVVTTAPRRVTAEVYIHRVHGIERMVQGELCLGHDCRPINDQGFARFDSLSGAGPVEVKIPVHFHQEFLISLAKSRLTNNFIDYTNMDFAKGRVPLDTLITAGENERTIIFFEKTDRWQEVINDYSWFTGTGYHSESLRFTYPGDTLRVMTSNAKGSVSDELAAKIFLRAQEAITEANAVYGSIPWKEKHQYIMTTETTMTVPDSANQGEIIIDPNAGIYRWLWRNYDLRNLCNIESMGAGMDHNHAFKDKGVEHFTKYLTLTMLGGIRAFAPARTNRFTQYPSDETALLHPVVEDDILAMRLYSMYSGCTQFLTTK